MLYKKIHRQYLREFKRGRKFKIRNINCKGKEYEVTKEPYVKGNLILADRSNGYDMDLIFKGSIHCICKDTILSKDITWLE